MASIQSLRKEFRELNLNSEEGQKRMIAITKELKNAMNELQKNRITIGNYKRQP